MKKLTKIGVSALAGSLAAVAANAGELSVSGSAVMSYTSQDGTTTTQGGGLGMKNNMTFTGSGDVNGMTVTYTNVLSDTAGVSSSNIAIDMGDNGVLELDQGTGGNGIAAIDDMTPTAWEESWDGLGSGPSFVGGSQNVIQYTNTIGGLGVNAMYDQSVNDTANADGNQNGAGSTSTASGSAASVAITLPALVDGLAAGFGYGESSVKNGTTTSTDRTSVTGYANYSMGPVTVGYNQSESAGGAGGAVTEATEGLGIVFNVNDDLSISYSQFTNDHKNTSGTADVEEESTAISIAYTMGGATLAIQSSEADNVNGSTAASADLDRTEINLSLAF